MANQRLLWRALSLLVLLFDKLFDNTLEGEVREISDNHRDYNLVPDSRETCDCRAEQASVNALACEQAHKITRARAAIAAKMTQLAGDRREDEMKSDFSSRPPGSFSRVRALLYFVSLLALGPARRLGILCLIILSCWHWNLKLNPYLADIFGEMPHRATTREFRAWGVTSRVRSTRYKCDKRLETTDAFTCNTRTRFIFLPFFLPRWRYHRTRVALSGFSFLLWSFCSFAFNWPKQAVKPLSLSIMPT